MTPSRERSAPYDSWSARDHTVFPDVGTGLPTRGDVHEVAQCINPAARCLRDNDPIGLANAHQLLRGTSEGATTYIYGELRETGEILEAAAQTLDFAEPPAINSLY